jgi:hypothetical protein
MITTSHDFVLIKNGTEIKSPMNCIITPNDRFTCRMMKYAVTTRNDPMILPTVSIFKVPPTSHPFRQCQHHQTTMQHHLQ